MKRRFLSPEPVVTMTNAFDRPFDNAVATARTCYSASGIVTEEKVVPSPPVEEEVRLRKTESRDRLAQDLYKAGHHTTLQHATFQFALSNVSRQFIWSFLHSHPFYNSEQVSQRYVTVKTGSYLVPPLEGPALTVYRETVEAQNRDYRELCETLVPLVEREYFGRFPARGRRPEPWRKEVRKKAQEIARYVLPVATFAYLYHTVSGLTLLRYYRTIGQQDVPLEQRIVVERMVELLLEHDPGYRTILEEPVPSSDTAEQRLLDRHADRDPASRRAFLREFDEDLGGMTSRLAGRTSGNEALLARSVREVFGLTRSRLSDEEAIAIALDPGRNATLGDTLNTTTHSKLTRTLFHPHYTFRKKLSHTADSQNQRHRMTPGSRPILAAHYTGDPDYVTPPIVAGDPAVRSAYDASMRRAWEGIESLRSLGVEDELALYLLPNAVSIRFTESADLLNLRHKLAMRLCYNAQEEIWRASLDEALQIREVDPLIGGYLLPPCTLRQMAASTPICPEGRRYCGERVWTYPLESYHRLI